MTGPLVPRPDGWVVQAVPRLRAVKSYVCPGCGNPIRGGEQHVVAWPEEQVDDRRHWHGYCWRIAVKSGRTAL